MAASIRLCCALRVTFRGAVPLRSMGGVFPTSPLATGVLSVSFQRNPSLPLISAAPWQQTRHGSFFNKLTAQELWKAVSAETGAGSKKGRGKRTKRKRKQDLNVGQRIGEGRGGFLWPGLNAPLPRDATSWSMSRRSEVEQQEKQSELERFRIEWERKRNVKVKKERGWTGGSLGGTSLGPPDPGPYGDAYEDFDSRVIEVRAVGTMTAKEGRKRSIRCLVAVGNGKGTAGFALGKAADRMTALKRAKNKAMHYLRYIERCDNHTIFHNIDSTVMKTTLHMRKKNRGHGLRCHRAVITMCKLIGIEDMYCRVKGSVNLLNITKALFSGLANQETHQALAEKKQLHVVEFRAERGALPIVVASPKHGARPNPEPEDEVPNITLHWDDVKAAQGVKRSPWAGVKRSIW
ncbi:28S ribosomal protein S5, mitochondrial [Thalassophryne amazonica]|uniref:28S ribosomal protein S5, mitochondrial n=1 Tax=Thalassophryne amazonica TaxID=390379 RepID=UPI001471D8AB|nr:28S ribosomal protein S5, mitochondrial [Thalassophryne amazonica]